MPNTNMMTGFDILADARRLGWTLDAAQRTTTLTGEPVYLTRLVEVATGKTVSNLNLDPTVGLGLVYRSLLARLARAAA